jgi:hypothetical protein
MYLLEKETGEKKEVVIEKVTAADWKLLKPNKQFHFKWKDYPGKEVFKLTLKENQHIIGLMCIIDHTDPLVNVIEIELLESREDQIGAAKKLDRIVGCLIAYACSESIKRGHEGVIFLTPKSGLIVHYRKKYGLEHLSGARGKPTGIMIGDTRNAFRLTREYLD